MGQASTRILIVDDHAVVRRGLRLLLEQQPGFEVVGEAEGAESAVRLADETTPDVVLMDLQMPGSSGLDATRRIRERNPAVRVVVLTSDCSRESVQTALRLGVSGYLLKENAPDDLLRAVRSAMEGRIYLCPEVTAGMVDDYLRSVPVAQESDEGRLTERETQLLRLLAEGKRSKEIATVLGVETKTVEVYRSRLMKKLGCSSAVELARYAIRHGIAAP